MKAIQSSVGICASGRTAFSHRKDYAAYSSNGYFLEAQVCAYSSKKLTGIIAN